MRPSSEVSPGAVPAFRVGVPADGGPDQPPPVGCCDTDPTDVPNRTADHTPLSLGDETGGSADVNETDGTVTDGGGNKTWLNPGNVNDGNSSTRAEIGSFAGAGITYTGDLISDLGADFEVSEFMIRADTDCSSTHAGLWLFASSDDGVIWTNRPATMDSETTIVLNLVESRWSINGGPVEARYWRLRWQRGPLGGFSCGSVVYTWEIHGATVISTTWSVLEPRVVDGDDATYEDVDGGAWSGEHLRFDLGAAYRITRSRIRLGTTTAGAKTLTLYGWNELDQSDIETVTTIPFTGTGSLTAQDVEAEWYTDDAFRYWQIDGPAEVVRWFEVELYEPTLATSHQHGIEGTSTTETDTDLVLHPDGSGGVTWGPDAGSGPLDDLSDVTITTPAENDTLRYVGGQWINDVRRWEPVTFNFGTGPELVWDGDNLVMEWKGY